MDKSSEFERRALLDKLKAALVTPIRAMRLRYLPLLSITPMGRSAWSPLPRPSGSSRP